MERQTDQSIDDWGIKCVQEGYCKLIILLAYIINLFVMNVSVI